MKEILKKLLNVFSIKPVYNFMMKLADDYMIKTIPIAIKENKRKIASYKTDIRILTERNKELEGNLKLYKKEGKT